MKKTNNMRSIKYRYFMQGTLKMLPLSIAIIPWGILAGSMAISAGLSIPKAIAMSVLVFAGAAQLVSLGLIMTNASVLTILITVFFLTSQHFIYALIFRKNIAKHPLAMRLGLGFLLTDELFALGADEKNRNRYYLLGAGLCFYVFWVVFSIIGIFLATVIPNLDDYHLDFSIIAIFVPIVLALMKNRAAFWGVISTCIIAFLLNYWHISGGMIIAGLCGMFIAALLEQMHTRKKGAI